MDGIYLDLLLTESMVNAERTNTKSRETSYLFIHSHKRPNSNHIFVDRFLSDIRMEGAWSGESVEGTG